MGTSISMRDVRRSTHVARLSSQVDGGADPVKVFGAREVRAMQVSFLLVSAAMTEVAQRHGIDPSTRQVTSYARREGYLAAPGFSRREAMLVARAELVQQRVLEWHAGMPKQLVAPASVVEEALTKDNRMVARITVRTRARATGLVKQLQGATPDRFDTVLLRTTVDDVKRDDIENPYFVDSPRTRSYDKLIMGARDGQVVGPIRIPTGWAVVQVRGDRRKGVPARPGVAASVAWEAYRSSLIRVALKDAVCRPGWEPAPQTTSGTPS